MASYEAQIKTMTASGLAPMSPRRHGYQRAYELITGKASPCRFQLIVQASMPIRQGGTLASRAARYDCKLYDNVWEDHANDPMRTVSRPCSSQYFWHLADIAKH